MTMRRLNLPNFVPPVVGDKGLPSIRRRVGEHVHYQAIPKATGPRSVSVLVTTSPKQLRFLRGKVDVEALLQVLADAGVLTGTGPSEAIFTGLTFKASDGDRRTVIRLDDVGAAVPGATPRTPAVVR